MDSYSDNIPEAFFAEVNRCRLKKTAAAFAFAAKVKKCSLIRSQLPDFFEVAFPHFRNAFIIVNIRNGAVDPQPVRMRQFIQNR